MATTRSEAFSGSKSVGAAASFVAASSEPSKARTVRYLARLWPLIQHPLVMYEPRTLYCSIEKKNTVGRRQDIGCQPGTARVVLSQGMDTVLARSSCC